MLGQWGKYPWTIDWGADKIHPHDLESFSKETFSYKVYECTDVTDEYITIKYGEKSYRVAKDLFGAVPNPKYHIGQKVKAYRKNVLVDGIISDIMWHFDRNKHYYLITIDGRKSSNWYFEDDFVE